METTIRQREPRLKLSEAIPQFDRHLQARGLQWRSRKCYIQPLRRALDQWGDIEVASIKPNHIDRLFEKSGWSARTINLYLMTMRGFIKWARRNGHLPRDYDPTDGWRALRAEQTEKTWIPIEEFPALLDAADNPRDRAVIAIGLFTFMRGSEISGLKIGDLDFDRHTIRMYRFKTKEYDTLPMAWELKQELLSWLNYYREQMGGRLEPGWFLVPARGPLPMRYDERLSCLQPTGEPARLRPDRHLFKPYESVKKAMVQLDYLVKGQGAHTLRRSGARALFDRLRHEGYDGALMRVSSMLGHKDTKTTEIYLGLGLEREQRNEMLAGQVMFPSLQAERGTVVPLEVGHGEAV